MAIAKLQLPTYTAPRDIDWSPLDKMGDAIRQGRTEQQLRDSLQAYANGDKQALLKSGDWRLANLYMIDLQRQQTQANADRTFNAGREDAAQAQRNADRSYGLQVEAGRRAAAAAARAADPTPEGFEANPAAATDPSQPKYRPSSGGPKDPAYIAAANAAKPRQMSINDITKLAEEGGKFADLSRFSDTFKDEYAGRPVIGEARNWVGRNLPSGVVDPAAAEGAAWWQGYDRYKNVVRNELYGSALTAPEKASFERADITPGMNPDLVKKNLSIQKQIVQNAMRRKADAMGQAGYSRDVVNKAYGVDPGEPQAAASAPQDSGAVDWQTYFGGAR